MTQEYKLIFIHDRCDTMCTSAYTHTKESADQFSIRNSRNILPFENDCQIFGIVEMVSWVDGVVWKESGMLAAAAVGGTKTHNEKPTKPTSLILIVMIS